MSLSEIDATAAKRQLQDIASASRAALDARVRRAAELAERNRQAVEREAVELKAALARKADAEAARAAAERAAEQEKPPEQPRVPPRPATLSLGAEEFRQAREQARHTPEPDRPARRRPPRPESDDDMSRRTWLR